MSGSADFASFFRKSEPLVRNFVLGRVHPGDLDDAVQDVFLAVSKHPEKIINLDEKLLKRWLIRVTRNVASNHRRKRKRKAPLWASGHTVDVDALADDRTNPEQETERHERERLACALVGDLPDHLHDVFVLIRFEQLGLEGAAEVLDRPLGTVKRQLTEASKRVSAAAERHRQGRPS